VKSEDAKAIEVMETGACDLAEMMLLSEFVVNEDSMVMSDMCRFDDVTADHKYGVSAGQLLKTLPRSKRHEFRLLDNELQLARKTV